MDLSPHILHKCSIKSLEWLIRKFNVNIFLAEEFLLAMVPYHDSHIFGRALDITELPDSWAYLSVDAKKKKYVPRILLASACDYSINLMETFWRHAIKLCERGFIYKNYLTFLVSLSLEYLEISEHKKLKKFLPHLIRGIASRNYELQLGCYMVISKLTSIINLKKDLCHEIFQAIVSYGTIDLNSTLCIAKLVESQGNTCMDPKILSKDCDSSFVTACCVSLSRYQMPAFYRFVIELCIYGGLEFSELIMLDELNTEELETATITLLKHDLLHRNKEAMKAFDLRLGDRFYELIKNHGTKDQQNKLWDGILNSLDSLDNKQRLIVSVRHPDENVRIKSILSILESREDEDLKSNEFIEILLNQGNFREIQTIIMHENSTKIFKKDAMFEICLAHYQQFFKENQVKFLKKMFQLIQSPKDQQTFFSKICEILVSGNICDSDVIDLIYWSRKLSQIYSDIIFFRIFGALNEKSFVGLNYGECRRLLITEFSRNFENIVDEFESLLASFDFGENYVCLFWTCIFYHYVSQSSCDPYQKSRIITFLLNNVLEATLIPSNHFAALNDLTRGNLELVFGDNLPNIASLISFVTISNNVNAVYSASNIGNENYLKLLRFTLKNLDSEIIRGQAKRFVVGFGEFHILGLYKIWSNITEPLQDRVIAIKSQLDGTFASNFASTNLWRLSLLALAYNDKCIRQEALTWFENIDSNSIPGFTSILSDIRSNKSSILLDKNRICVIMRDGLGNLNKKAYKKLMAGLFGMIDDEKISGTILGDILRVLSFVDCPDKSKELLKLLNGMLSDVNRIFSEYEKYKSVVRNVLTIGTSKLLRSDTASDSVFSKYLKILAGNLSNTKLTLAFIETLSPQFFSSLAAHNRKPIMDIVIRLIESPNNILSSGATKTLGYLPFDSEELRMALSSILGINKDNLIEGSRSKKQKTKESLKLGVSSSLVSLYEIMDKNSTSTLDPMILPALFDALGFLLECKTTGVDSSDLEYCMQLSLSIMRNLIIRTSKSSLDQDSIRVDLVVQSIRISGNPQTHQFALLLLAAICKEWPKKVICNVMPVFTFMGTNVIKQDDSYSFYVIEQTIQNLLPPLVKDSNAEREKIDRVGPIKPILMVFINAFYHIPKHRRVRLFGLLVQTLGTADFLDIIIMLLLRVHGFAPNSTYFERDESVGEFSFALAKSMQYLPLAENLLDSISKLNVQKFKMFFDLKSAEQSQKFQIKSLDWISSFVGSDIFSRIIKMNTTEYGSSLESFSEKLISLAISFVNNVKQDSMGAKKLKYFGFKIIEQVTFSISTENFFRNIHNLIKGNEEDIQEKIVALFNSKWDEISDNMKYKSPETLESIFKQMNLIINHGKSKKIRENAFLAIERIGKVMTHTNYSLYASVILPLISEKGIKNSTRDIQLHAIVCLGVVISSLGAKSIPYLPKLAPVVINELKQHTSDRQMSDALLQLVAIIFESLPKFVGPYLGEILEVILEFDETMEQSFDLVSKIIVDVLPKKAVIESMLALHSTVIKNSKYSAENFFLILLQVEEKLSPDLVSKYYQKLFLIYLYSFEQSELWSTDRSREKIAQIERSIIGATIGLIMKINESMFKPIFLKFIDWASRKTISLTPKSRIYYFYRICDGLLDTMKSLFSPYMSYVLDDLVRNIQEIEVTKNSSLWEYLIEVTRKTFLYDVDNNMGEMHYSEISKPLIDQLEIAALGNRELILVQDYVIPCIGQLLASSGSSRSHKDINSHILMCTRNESAEVRLVSVRCLKDLHSKMGEELLEFLPETIPFLSELLEDDSEIVEQECRALIQIIETYLGESIQEHLK